ncbi:MAG: HAD-IA family hydrolase [Gammaproteobacteria bacterium]
MIKLPIDPIACVFDLDGTLLDTERLYTEAAQKILDPFGHTYSIELKRKVMGGDSIRSARLTIEEFDLPMTPQQFLDERETYLEALFPVAEEIKGAGDFIRHLTDIGLRQGLATSSHSHLCELKIGHRGWRERFAAVVCGDDAELQNSKPAPDIFLLCAARMGVDPASTVAFEDSRNGIEAARAAGMFVIGIESIYTTPEDLVAADLTVPDFYTLI